MEIQSGEAAPARRFRSAFEASLSPSNWPTVDETSAPDRELMSLMERWALAANNDDRRVGVLSLLSLLSP